jgi:hypothetical protein
VQFASLTSKLEGVAAKQEEGKEEDGEDLADKRDKEHKTNFAKARADHYGNEFAAMQKARAMMDADDEEEDK